MNQLTGLSLADAESFSFNPERGRAGSQSASPLSPAARARLRQSGVHTPQRGNDRSHAEYQA